LAHLHLAIILSPAFESSISSSLFSVNVNRWKKKTIVGLRQQQESKQSLGSDSKINIYQARRRRHGKEGAASKQQQGTHPSKIRAPLPL
jgi:hypothetical protein